MDFGKVPEKELKKIDLSLPPEPAGNKKVLSSARGAAKPGKPAVYIGCAKWGIKEWVGKIYPPKTSDKNFLEHYVQHYNSIELNATHYQVYGPDVISKWAEKAKGAGF